MDSQEKEMAPEQLFSVVFLHYSIILLSQYLYFKHKKLWILSLDDRTAPQNNLKYMCE